MAASSNCENNRSPGNLLHHFQSQFAFLTSTHLPGPQSQAITLATYEAATHRKPPASKCRVCFRKFFAFLVSNVGLCLAVVAYSIGGAFVFRAVEAPFEVRTAKLVNELRNRTIGNLWNISKCSNKPFSHLLPQFCSSIQQQCSLL